MVKQQLDWTNVLLILGKQALITINFTQRFQIEKYCFTAVCTAILTSKKHSVYYKTNLYFCQPDTSEGNQYMKFVSNMTAKMILSSDLKQSLKQPGLFYTGSLQAHRPGNIMPNQHQGGRLQAMLWGLGQQLHSISYSEVKKKK